MDIRHTITRFGATALIGCGLAVTAIPATFAQNGEESVTHVYSDKATSHISEVWYKGETLKVTGEGFLTQDGTSGSTIAIKLNKGSVKIDGKDYLEVQADEKGNFSVSIPWQDDLDERISVDVYLLSGSLKDNDTARGGKAATVKIEARSVQEATPQPHLLLRALPLLQPLLWWLPPPLLLPPLFLWRLPHLLRLLPLMRSSPPWMQRLRTALMRKLPPPRR